LPTDHDARLHWQIDLATRSLPASGYSAPTVFDDEAEAWSLVVIPEQQRGREELVLIHFLTDDAPTHLLQTGASFSLREGPKTIAEGEITAVFDLALAA
jgi:hypothetical protein